MKHFNIILSLFAVWFVGHVSCLAQSSYQWTNFVGKPGGYGNVDSTGGAAEIPGLVAVVADAGGNIYGATNNSNTIVKISATGVVSTLAGSSGIAGSADGTGGAARFKNPQGLAMDDSGNLYVVDTSNHTIRRVTPEGVVTTVAGLAGTSGSTDGTGNAARFNIPNGVAVDHDGNLYVTEYGNHTVRKITAAGVVTTLAGLAGGGGSADGTGGGARFRTPFGISVGGDGNIYVADNSNYTIRKVTPAGVVTTIAGLAGSNGSEDGSGSTARFIAPTGIVVAADGNIYVSDGTFGFGTLRKVTPAGVVTTIAGLAENAGSADGTGSAARFGSAYGIAIDLKGNILVADDFKRLRRVTPAGEVTTLAGTPASFQNINQNGLTARFYGLQSVGGSDAWGTSTLYAAEYNAIRKITGVEDQGGVVVKTLAGLSALPVNSSGSADGQGTSARFNLPRSAMADSSGNVYVADSGNKTIRKITPTGLVTTLAGLAGSAGSTDGTGSGARFNSARGLTILGGNIYVADGSTIRKVTPAGVVTTLAGGFTDASAITSTGSNLYVVELSRHIIRKISTTGVVTTLAGSAGLSGSADGVGSAARFNSPQGIAVDASEVVYVSDSSNLTIRKVTPSGAVTTLAGVAGIAGDVDGVGANARFRSPLGATLLGGALYVVDAHTVRRINTATGAVETVAGQPSSYGSVDGTGIAAQFGGPYDVAVDSGGNLYVADNLNGLIRKVSPSGVATTFAGNGSGATEDGIGTAAGFRRPAGIAFDDSGDLYVVDSAGLNGGCIRKITPAGVVTTLAGPSSGGGSEDGIGSDARFMRPRGLALDGNNNAYVADLGNHTIRKVTPGGVVTTFAGLAQTPGASDGTGNAARFLGPWGVAVDRDQNVYVSEYGNHTIRKITPAGDVTTFAGAAGVIGSADGTGSVARFYYPSGMKIDSAGNLYVADQNNCTIRKITPAGVVTTIGGTAGKIGGMDGIGAAAQFNFPSGLGLSQAGDVFVADYQNNRISVGMIGPMVTTIAASLVTGSAAALNATVIRNGEATTCYFEYSTNADLNNPANVSRTADQQLPAGSLPVEISAGLTGLTPFTTYYARAVGMNSTATRRGNVVQFTTPAPASYPLALAAYQEGVQFSLTAGTNALPTPTLDMIRFMDPGATNFGMVDPLIYPLPAVTVSKPSNFNDVRARDAQAHLRQTLSELPNFQPAQLKLLETLYARIVAYNFAGNNSIQYSSRARITPPTPYTSGAAEMRALADAYYFYKQAVLAFAEAAGNPIDLPILDLTSPHIDVTAIKGDLTTSAVGVIDVIDAVGRGMAMQGKTALRHATAFYMQNYSDPLTQAYSPTATLSLIDGYIDQLKMELLMFQAFRKQPVFEFCDVATVQTSIAELKSLRSAVERGNLAFASTREGSTDTFRAIKEYTPQYVPFLAPTGGLDSFTRLKAHADNLVFTATSKDTAAQANTVTLAANRAGLQQKIEEIRLRHLDELKSLCGYTQELVDGQMQAIPDFSRAILPPAKRDAVRSYNLSGNLESKGAIYKQWLTWELARKEVEGASLELAQIYKRIQRSQQTAQQIANLDLNMANLILTNGDKLAALDQMGGTIQAESAQELAEVSAKAQEATREREESWRSLSPWQKLGAGALVAVFSSGASIAAAIGTTVGELVSTGGQEVYRKEQNLPQVADKYQAAAADIRKTGAIQASTANRLAELEASKTKLRASENAAVQMNAAQATLIKNAEEVHYLFQQAERQLINMAALEDRLEMEVAELADMYGRVGFLTQEYYRAMVQAYDPSYNPLTLPDYRFLKEKAVDEAEDAFVRAQRWAYLCARLAQYEDNFSNLETTTIRNALLAIVKARTGSELAAALDTLASARADLELQRNSVAQGYTAEFSLRNDLAQNNYLPINADGSLNLANALLQQYPNGLTSDADWLNFLNASVIQETSAGGGVIDVLVIPLAVTLERPFGAQSLVATYQQRTNQFFDPTRYGDLINYNPGVGALGVQVMIQARSVSFPGTDGQVTANLVMAGSSQIRSRAWLDETDGRGVINWNLQQATDSMIVSFNSYGSTGNPLLNNRSPANDRWILKIYRGSNTNYAKLFSNLDKITDIKLKFHIKSYIKQ